jgi:hypothetical protein
MDRTGLGVKAFDDALDLLQKQGDVFIDSDLIFLRPQFVTELLRPLIDHTLTREKLNIPGFKSREN